MDNSFLANWIALKQFFSYPSVSAATAAMVMATLKLVGSAQFTIRRGMEIPMVGVASYSLVPITIGLGLDDSYASGIGAFVGYMGMVELEHKIDALFSMWGNKRERRDGSQD